MKHLWIIFTTLIIAPFVSAADLKPVIYHDGSQQLKGYVTSNAGKDLPAILILPAWKGVDNEAIEAAKLLETEGYIAFIADIYGVGNTPEDNAEAGKMASKYIKDFKAYQHRIELALQEMKKHTGAKENIAVIGYCFGGTGTLEVVRAGMNVKGIVCIHGGLQKDAARKNEIIRTKILVLNPADDGSVTEEIYNKLLQEFKDGEAKDWQIITYANSKHTFTNPQSPDYNPVMANRAWKHTLMFLDEILRKQR